MMKMNKEEVESFASMMEWANDNKKINKFSCYVQNNTIFIVAMYSDKKIVQGNGKTMTEAMEGYSRSMNMILTTEQILDGQ